VTGESKKNRVEPKRPFPHGPGAIEIGARFEELRFDDVGPDEGFAGAGDRARNIRPAADRAFTGGVSWWPVHWVRFMGNVVVERYLDPLLAPEPGRRGNYVTLLARAQVALP
jgi:phosphate-selective porin